MKLLALPDLHLTDQQPRSRTDNLSKTQEKKIRFIFDFANANDIDIMFQPGDFCDVFIAPDKFKTRLIRLFKYSPKIICVYGQHDCRYHTSNISNTPFGVLMEALNLKLATDKPYTFSSIINPDPVSIYGASWGKEIPKITTPKDFNILLIHKMIVIDKLWAAQEDYEVSGTFLRRNKFDLVISGDNHQSFHMFHKNKWLINCGSLMRSDIDQADHKPCIWIFDTKEREAEQIMIPIEPFSKVVNLEKAEKEKEENLKLKSLSDLLKKRSKIKGLKYKERVFRRIERMKKARELKPRTEKILEMVMADELFFRY